MNKSSILIAVLVTNLATVLQAQSDSMARLDSLSLDTLLNGPAYTFRGDEDSLLLARVFAETYKLGQRDAGNVRQPDVLCLAVGRLRVADAPVAVFRVLADHRPRVRPASVCHREVRGGLFTRVADSVSGGTAWILTIRSLAHASDDTITVYSSHYVGPLWGAGWVCLMQRQDRDWRVVHCVSTWIS